MSDGGKSRQNWFDGPEVTLEELLSARETRVLQHENALAAGLGPIVTVSVVMPGAVKDCALSRLVQGQALKSLTELAQAMGWAAKAIHAATHKTGPEALISINAEPGELKQKTVAIEETHPLGRLFDLDVSTADGRTIARGDLHLPSRRCLVCGQPAKACARSRAHAAGEVRAAMEKLVDAWVAD